MRRAKPAVLALLFIAGACASTMACAGSQKTTPSKGPIEGGIVEFQLISYDGRELFARVLVSNTRFDREFVVNGRLLAFEDVSLESVRACGTNNVMRYKEWDETHWNAIVRPVTLEKDNWHGENVYFPLFDRAWPWPACFDATLSVRTVDGRVIATRPVRIERTDKAEDEADGGAEPPPPPAPDGGAPRAPAARTPP